MTRRILALMVITITTLLIYSCAKENEQRLQQKPVTDGSTNCDTVNMSYSLNIKPILQANCYSCHASGISSGGVTLDTYEGVKRVADNGRLSGAINHLPGFRPMPQGSAKLSDCLINKIQGWINRGKQNN